MELDHLTLLTVQGETIERTGRGIGPLLHLYLDCPDRLKGARLFDKVIGKAAAAICVLSGVKEVNAHLMSVSAQTLLTRYGIKVECEILADKILNRSQTDLCPMEKACLNEEEPENIVLAIERQAKAMGII